MKQHVTVEQLKELTNKQQINLATLAGEYGNCCNTGGETINLGKLRGRFTIGKMIKILDYHHSELYNKLDIYKNDLDEWCIGLNIGEEIVLLAYSDELCDALWKAVKKIID